MELPPEQRLSNALENLNEGYISLKTFSQCHIIKSDFLEGVAKVRVVIHFIAELLHVQISSTKESDTASTLPIHGSPLVSRLLHTAEKVCLDSDINFTNVLENHKIAGPHFYLVKILIRLHGLPFLRTVIEKYPWIMPGNLATAADVS